MMNKITISIFAVTTLLSILLYLPYLDTLRLWHEEPRRALISEAMLESGDFIVPRYREEVYVAKPPLFNWLVIGVSQVFGEINELSLRFTSLLCLILLIGLMLSLHQQWLGTTGLVFLSLALALSPEFMSKATLGEIDMCFTLLVSASLWLWFSLDQKQARGFNLWLAPGLLIALAFLTKREPAFLFYYVGIGTYLLYRKRLIELFLPAHLICASITLAIVGAWVWFMVQSVGLEVLLGSTVNEVVNRGIVGSWATTLKHIISYPFEVTLAVFPFSLMLLLFFHRESRAIAFERYGDVLVFAGITVIANFLVYWFIAQSAVRYFLPMLPSVLVVCAVLFEVAEQTAPRWLRVLGSIVASLTLLAAIALNVFLFQANFGFGPTPPDLLPHNLAVALSLASVLLGLWLLWFNINGKTKHLLLAFCGLMLVYRIIYIDAVLPRKVAQFEQERDIAGFVAKIYHLVPARQLPINATGTVPHEIWWAMEYGDITTKPSVYQLTDTPPTDGHRILANMNFRGRDISLVLLHEH